MTLDKINSKKRYKLVIESLKNYIISEGLEPGDKLPSEKELSEMLGVGRTSIREATKALEVLGILEIKAGNGMFVRNFNYDFILDNLTYTVKFERKDLKEVLDIRINLELSYIRKAVDNISDKEVKLLTEKVKQMKQASFNNNVRPFVIADKEFHKILFSTVDNKLLTDLLNTFWNLLERSEDFEELTDKNLSSGYKRHNKILKAIKDENADEAKRLLDEHYRYTQERVE